MTLEELQSEYTLIYSRQYKKIEKLINEYILSDTFYYKSGAFNKSRKLALLQQLKELLEEAKKHDKAFIEEFEESYKLNVEEIVKDFEKTTGESVQLRKEWTKIDEKDVSILAKDFTSNMNAHRGAYYTQLARRIDSWDNENRRFIENATRDVLEDMVIGGDTKKVSIKRLSEKLANYGLTSYDYKDSNNRIRRINLDTYASIQVNSKVAYLTNKGVKNTGLRLDHKRYQFSSHQTHCEICAMYAETDGVGRVYSLDQDDKFPWIGSIPNFLTYYQLHPNCRHRISLYFEEYSDKKEESERVSAMPFKDRRSKKDKKAYDDSQKAHRLRRANRINLQERKGIKAMGKDATQKDKKKLKRLEETSRRRREELKRLAK